jgi:hypothetical protein
MFRLNRQRPRPAFASLALEPAPARHEQRQHLGYLQRARQRDRLVDAVEQRESRLD